MLALLLVQGPSVRNPAIAAAIHAEDARTFEAALLGYWGKVDGWGKGRPGSTTLYVPDITEGPSLLARAPDGSPPGDALWPVEASLRANYRARNAVPVSLAWFRPADARIRLVPKDDPERRGRPEYRQYCRMAMPGYAKDRRHALVRFSFNEGVHSGQATVWLEKRSEVWRMTDFRDVHFL